ncbi:MAG: hypothetical protein Q7K34_02350 [archaeon]|nr:hypothetical protein [archaeon]
MSFEIPKFSSREILSALKRARRGEELSDREIAAIKWDVEL